MFDWLKKLGSPRNRMPSTWGIRQWAAALTGQTVGDVTLDSLLRSSAVVACSGLIADSLAAAPLAVVQRLQSGGMRSVLQSNATTTLLTLTYDDRSACIFGACTTGNGWLRLSEGALYALDSQRTSAYVDENGAVWIKQGGDDYVPYDQIAHVRFRSAPGFVLGFSPLLLAQDSMKAALSITAMAAALAANAQSPSGVLQYPNILTDKALTNLRESWKEAQTGERQGSIAVLESGVEYKELGAPTATDAQLVSSLEWGAADIARMFAVPPEMVGLLRDSNRATSTEAARAFAMRCLKPWAARVGDALGRLLLTPDERAQGLAIEVDLTELSLGQGEERARYLRELVNSGILRSNEARNSIGFEDDVDGSKLRFPLNAGPADQPAQPPGQKLSIVKRDALGHISEVEIQQGRRGLYAAD